MFGHVASVYDGGAVVAVLRNAPDDSSNRWTNGSSPPHLDANAANRLLTLLSPARPSANVRLAMAKGSHTSVFALEYLSAPAEHATGHCCVLFGDDDFLKAESWNCVRRQVLDGEDADLQLTTLEGPKVRFHELADSLATISLFGGGEPLVLVEEADTFVSQYRPELEDLLSGIHRGVLVLDVKSWPSNTRLAKAVSGKGLVIDCRSITSFKSQEQHPRELALKRWLADRAKASYEVRLESAAVDALLELVPPEPGILVQEVARLALLVERGRPIDAKFVREHVGGWRTKAVWDLADAAADGRAAEAFKQLERLIQSGEKPHGLLPQIAPTLRRFAAAISLIESAEAEGRRLPPREALKQAEVLPFKLADAERQLRRLGRRRARLLSRWLLATDLAIKGYHSSDDNARLELEQLIVRMAGEPTPQS